MADQFQNQDPEAIKNWETWEDMYEHALNQVQGTFGSEYQIDMVAPNGEATPAELVAGSVAILNSDGEFILDPGDGTANAKPSFFVRPAGGYAGGVAPTGNAYGDGILALPASVGYKLQSTEVVIAGTLEYGELLTVADENPGKITNDANGSGAAVVPGTDKIIGYAVSVGGGTGGINKVADKEMVTFISMLQLVANV